ncbi:hypothetical protein LP122_10135 [Moraxella bovis]|uniref:hypothetical protein n=1 Tax=Moraxella bovis TaxID=476 RepID=UPI002225BC20|nr:hypothetical protein [Moraxella bovis]UYZ68111.1 hypothetical protein LP122_10135 [Moraxella bovis]UZA27854.1 hypothetical protein LP119_02415 [Moraxella bovis]WAJ74050.1 hypothetical protein LP095_02415 [Moraxella bovis]
MALGYVPDVRTDKATSINRLSPSLCNCPSGETGKNGRDGSVTDLTLAKPFGVAKTRWDFCFGNYHKSSSAKTAKDTYYNTHLTTHNNHDHHLPARTRLRPQC